ncbi:MAG: outer membrane protein assembly factor BamE [Pseudomonadota bacterium]
MQSATIVKKVKSIMLVIIKFLIGFSLLIFAAVLAFWWWASKGIYSTSKFNPEVWFAKQTNESEMGCYRGSMAFDVRDNLLVNGMSKEKVVSLLGAPDLSKDSEYQYVLGICSGLRIDYDVLHVYFKDGGFVNAKVYQH